MPHVCDDAATNVAAPLPARRSAPQNRISVLMAHTVRYAFEPQARLAEDIGVSRSTISRLIRGKCRPSYELVRRVVAALDAALEDRPLGDLLSAREVFSPDGTYPTRSACALCGCSGCMPEAAYDRDGNLRSEYRDMRPGEWTLAPVTPQENNDPPQTA